MSKRRAMAAVALALGVCLFAGTASAVVTQLTPDIIHGGSVTVINCSPLHDLGSLPGNAVDGNTGSVFFSPDSGWGQWFLVLDLGQQYLIDHYTMRYYTPNTGFSVTNRFTVGNSLTSGLGSPRVTPAVGGVFDDFTGSVAGNAALQPDYVAVNTAIAAQFVDISVPGGQATGSTGGVYEVQVFGSVVETPVPEPGTMMLLGTGVLGALGYARRRMMK